MGKGGENAKGNLATGPVPWETVLSEETNKVAEEEKEQKEEEEEGRRGR